MLMISILAIVAGCYLLLLTQAPKVVNLRKEPEVEQKIEENKVIIKSAKIEVGIFEGGVEALEKGAWHRYPERGNPEKGGNFIISAHRFGLGPTPQATIANSAFYNIDRIGTGDGIIIHWEGKEYEYEVSRKYEVEPDAVQIEDEREEHILTMYSCTLGGRYDGRIVIEAKLKD